MRYTGELRESTRDDRGHRRWQAAGRLGQWMLVRRGRSRLRPSTPERSSPMATINEQQTYPAPGEPGSPVEVEAALRQLHRRRVGRAVHGRVQRERDARRRASRSPRSPRSTAEDIELALDAAHAAKDAVGRGLDDRALARPERDRRRDRGQPRDARGRRELGERQAGPRDARGGHPARGRPLPLLRGGDPRARRARSRRSTRTRSPTTSTSRSASSARSSRSTSRC